MQDQAFVEEMEKINKWVAELRSLGVDTRKTNELNNDKELENLTENIKQNLYQEYKTAYA